MIAEVLIPIQITGAMITACNVSEPDASMGEVAWNAATSYVIGNPVARPTTHKIYVAIASGVDAGLPENTPTRWRESGPTNLFAAFDTYVSTAIKKDGTLTITAKPGVVTDMVFHGLVGDTLGLVCRPASGGAAYFNQTVSLADYLTGDLMWEFYFGTPKQQTFFDVRGLVPQEAQIELTLTPSTVTGKAEIGIWAIGSYAPIGIPLAGFTARPVDFSRITTNAYGETTIIKGLAAKNITGECLLESAAEGQMAFETMYEVLGIPCAYSISRKPGFTFLNGFGLGTAEVIPYATHAKLIFDMRGLI